MEVLAANLDQVRSSAIDRFDSTDDFNFRHFRMRHMVAELLRTGLAPGGEAPDFELQSTVGRQMRLRDLRGQPVLLHFVSYTCPVTRGGVYTMSELHRLYGDRVHFVEILVRQAHPGERHGAYRSFDEKLSDARAYKREEHLPWPVLVDDLAGTVQRGHGGLAAAVYLIDRLGVIRFCGTWGQSPALREAFDALIAGDHSCAQARKGTDRRPHLAAAIVAGQRGPIRGGRRALIDLELGFPGAMILMTIGRLARPALAPLAVRTTPVPTFARAALLVGLLASVVGVGRSVRRARAA
jgi:AhpC/TSA family